MKNKMKTIKNITTQQFQNAVTQINPNATFDEDHPNHVAFFENVQIEIRRSSMACGYGSSKPVQEQLKTILENSNFTLKSDGPANYFVIEYDTDDCLARYLELYNLIANADIDFTRASDPYSGLNKDGLFVNIASVLETMHKTKMYAMAHRYVFDAVDDIIALNKKTDTNNYREHLVPCTMLFREAFRMFDEDNASVIDVAVMLQSNLFILHIPTEIAKKMDTTLGLKTSMPDGWKFGDCIFARLEAAGYDYNA